MLTFNKKALPFIVFSLAFIAGASILLEGCGFRLRGAVELPASLSNVAIQGTTEHTELGRVLYRSLKRGGVSIVPVDSAALRIQILRDEVQRRVLSLDATGKANEYELKHLLRYSAIDDQGQFLIDQQEITSVRAYRFDPNLILAKGDEEAQLRKQIIAASAQQLLRQLSAAMRRHTDTTPKVPSAEGSNPAKASLPTEQAPASQ